MEKNFNISVNKTYDFNWTEEQLDTADVASLDHENFHILLHDQSFTAKIVESDFNQKKYTVSINNTIYEVDIHNNLDKLIKEMGFEIGKSKQVNVIKAPMPGLILEIAVSVGDQVNEGDNLLILEAMKMENSFYSPRTGIIRSIAVTKGQAVDKGQLLIEFE